MAQLKAYSINLARRADRWERMQSVFPDGPITLERFDAIDASDPAQEAPIARLPARGPFGALSRSTLGCTASHFALWEHALRSDPGGERWLFLEDDMVFSPIFQPVTEKLLTEDHGYDVIKLESSMVFKHKVFLGAPERQIGEASLRRGYNTAIGSAAYILSRRAVKRALSLRGAVNLPLDHFVFSPVRRPGCLGMPFAVCDPSLTVQEKALPSDLAKGRVVGSRDVYNLRKAIYDMKVLPSLWRGATRGGARIVRQDRLAGGVPV